MGYFDIIWHWAIFSFWFNCPCTSSEYLFLLFTMFFSIFLILNDYQCIYSYWQMRFVPFTHTFGFDVKSRFVRNEWQCGWKLVSDLLGDLNPPTGQLLVGSCFSLVSNGERHTEPCDQTERMWSHLVTVLTDGMWPACSLGGVGPACNCRKAEQTATMWVQPTHNNWFTSEHNVLWKPHSNVFVTLFSLFL